DPLLLAAAGTKKYLHTLVTSFKNKPHEDLINSTNASTNVVDPADFTSEALSQNSKKNDNVIFTLYGALPFSSKEDGSRFNSQLLLRNHLNTISKIDDLTSTFNSFGWFQGENDWMNVTDVDANEAEEKKEEEDAEEDDGRKDTVEADEMRDKCMICGKKEVK
ncbi:hypothetical protein TrRE_jg12719, partial [Triparma retinervis]